VCVCVCQRERDISYTCAYMFVTSSSLSSDEHVYERDIGVCDERHLESHLVTYSPNASRHILVYERYDFRKRGL